MKTIANYYAQDGNHAIVSMYKLIYYHLVEIHISEPQAPVINMKSLKYVVHNMENVSINGNMHENLLYSCVNTISMNIEWTTKNSYHVFCFSAKYSPSIISFKSPRNTIFETFISCCAQKG